MHKILFAPAACLLVLGVAGAAELLDVPTLKEGLWNIHAVRTSAGQPPQESTTSLCRSHAYDKYVQGLAQKVMANCTLLSDAKLGGKRTITMSCKVNGTTITTKTVSTSSGDNYYRSETQTTYTPALYGLTSDSTVQEQTYAGAARPACLPETTSLRTDRSYTTVSISLLPAERRASVGKPPVETLTSEAKQDQH